jgi:Rrf2 family protein
MTMLSTASTYAIRATLFVAVADLAPGEFLSTRRIAEELDVPFPFLTKVMQGLTHGGILASQRGPAGGVALARPTDAISLLDVLHSVDGDHVFRSCLLGLPQCSAASPCALHHEWAEHRGELEELFRNTTLADLAADAPSAVAKGSRRRSLRAAALQAVLPVVRAPRGGRKKKR